ncbi:hypothetical protein [Haloarchaeobius sp. HME9146]|uniref:hypothetical protein n=1 Tax=Haloarchaeobius sp. HME9146 TaxID=2978732 RepID=UPI0021C12964|nr:hypothetical protein [Haloarchaeobius sp. HME9146]MCT9098226.1 hypothetical protein [Haloarchaeobius sp. HME9146]
MTKLNVGRWLVVSFALVALVFGVSVVGAHGDDPAAEDAPPYDGTAAEWATWMEAHMTEHMGEGAVEWMESHMGGSMDEMGRGMAGGAHGPGMADGTRGPGMAGMGRGC